MSEAASALEGRLAPGPVTIREAGPAGMVTLRGDLSDDRVTAAAAAGAAGVAMPGQGRIEGGPGAGLAWMSYDELLLLVPHARAGEIVADLGQRLAGIHHLVANVSDARALIHVEGAGARETIAKLAPLDLHPDAFAPGLFRRSRLGQVAAAFWMTSETDFAVICFRSVADYVFGLLDDAAKAGPVGHFSQG